MFIDAIQASKILKHDWFDEFIFGTKDRLTSPVAATGTVGSSASADEPDLCPPWKLPFPPHPLFDTLGARDGTNAPDVNGLRQLFGEVARP